MPSLQFAASRRRVRKELISPEEFASLKEVGNGPAQSSIPENHKLRLIALGYVRETTLQDGRIGLALTGAGLKRLVTGDWWMAADRVI